MTDINTFVAQSTIILTGNISRRIKKYDTEEERQQAKLMSSSFNIKSHFFNF